MKTSHCNSHKVIILSGSCRIRFTVPTWSHTIVACVCLLSHSHSFTVGRAKKTDLQIVTLKSHLDSVTFVFPVWLLSDGGGGSGGCVTPPTPHLSQDDDLRVFTRAPPLPLCEADCDASPSAQCRNLPRPSPRQQLGLYPVAIFTHYQCKTLSIKVTIERVVNDCIKLCKDLVGVSLFMSSDFVETQISLDRLGP